MLLRVLAESHLLLMLLLKLPALLYLVLLMSNPNARAQELAENLLVVTHCVASSSLFALLLELLLQLLLSFVSIGRCW